MLEPFEVKDQETLDKIICKLRVVSWQSVGILTQGDFPANVCQDEHDEHALHWAVKDKGQIIAAARLCIHDTISDLPDAGFYQGLNLNVSFPAAAITRLVVHPDYQRQGISRQLDEIRILTARKSGCRSVLGVSPPIRVNSLEKQGFTAIGSANLSQAPDWLKEAMRLQSYQRIVLVLPL